MDHYPGPLSMPAALPRHPGRCSADATQAVRSLLRLWVAAYRPAGWPLREVPIPKPDPYLTVDGTPHGWSGDRSLLATIDSLVAGIDHQDLQQSLQEAVIRGREALQGALPEGFRINVDDSDATSAEAY